jgi:hypothetical protein
MLVGGEQQSGGQFEELERGQDVALKGLVMDVERMDGLAWGGKAQPEPV